MAITKYGLGLIVGSWVLFLLFLALALFTRGWVSIAIAVISGLFAVFNLYFFRDPERSIPENPQAILSPADGKVVQITKVTEEEYFHRDVTRLSIFLSVFDVHVNRMPVSGKIDYFNYHRGSYLMAFKEKASLENEQTVIGVAGSNGEKILFKQIAGIIARRIVCEVRPGDSLQAGERMGMIRYGSRTDIFFDTEKVELKVGVSDKVKGGESILGEFK